MSTDFAQWLGVEAKKNGFPVLMRIRCLMPDPSFGILIEPDAPTIAREMPTNFKNAGAASRLRMLLKNRSKARLRQTEHPNALPTSWRCPGQHKAGHGKFFHFYSCRIAFGHGCDCSGYVSAKCSPVFPARNSGIALAAGGVRWTLTAVFFGNEPPKFNSCCSGLFELCPRALAMARWPTLPPAPAHHGFVFCPGHHPAQTAQRRRRHHR